MSGQVNSGAYFTRQVQLFAVKRFNGVEKFLDKSFAPVAYKLLSLLLADGCKVLFCLSGRSYLTITRVNNEYGKEAKRRFDLICRSGQLL